MLPTYLSTNVSIHLHPSHLQIPLYLCIFLIYTSFHPSGYSTYLFIYMSIFSKLLYIRLYIYPTYLPIHLHIYSFIYLPSIPIYLFIIFISTYRATNLTIYLPIHPSIYLPISSINVSICPSISSP